jgi:hypothetical protein
MKWSFDNLVPISDLEMDRGKKVELFNHSFTDIQFQVISHKHHHTL